MNFLPLVGFYYRRHDKISALLAKGSAGSGQVLIDFAKALAPVINKHWPHINEDGLLDDAIETLDAALTGNNKVDANYPDPKDR